MAGMSTKQRSTWMTTSQVCEYLGVSPDTFAKWRGKRQSPPARRLPNGQLRFRADLVEVWMEGLAA